jgi:hypothetical protein
MPKLLMLAGGVVPGSPRALGAYVVLSAGTQSRVFKVKGSEVEELPAATTLDVKRFERELREDLGPALEKPPAAQVTDIVREHLHRTEGMDVEG